MRRLFTPARMRPILLEAKCMSNSEMNSQTKKTATIKNKLEFIFLSLINSLAEKILPHIKTLEKECIIKTIIDSFFTLKHTEYQGLPASNSNFFQFPLA